MPKTFTAPFAQTPETWNATASTAFALTGTNSLADGAPQNTVLLGTAGVDGAILTKVTVQPRGTTAAVTMVAVFLRKVGDGATVRRLLKTIAVPATTVSSTAAIPETDFNLATETAPLRLGAGDELYVGTSATLAAGFVFNASPVQF